MDETGYFVPNITFSDIPSGGASSFNDLMLNMGGNVWTYAWNSSGFGSVYNYYNLTKYGKNSL